MNPIYSRRRRTDILIRGLCFAAALFGVTWLALILFTLRGRHPHAAAVPGVNGAAQDERAEARLAADARGDFLIERDGVADVVEANAFGRRAGHQGDVVVMPLGIAEMRHAGEDGQVVAMPVEDARVAGMLVVAAGLLRKEERRMHAERPTDQHHALRAGGGLLAVRHGVEQR